MREKAQQNPDGFGWNKRRTSPGARRQPRGSTTKTIHLCAGLLMDSSTSPRAVWIATCRRTDATKRRSSGKANPATSVC